MSEPARTSPRSARATADPATRAAVDDLLGRLEGIGDPEVAAWWERYLRGAIRFRGIRMAGVRKGVEAWAGEPAHADPSLRRAAGLEAFGSPWAEDKIAGILVLQLEADGIDLDALDAIADLFRVGLVADWNTTDWLCVKVLDRVVRRDPALADRVAGWALDRSEATWLRRAGLVGFVGVAPAWAAGSDSGLERVIAAADALASSTERFHQTAVGWVVREISRGDAVRATEFLRARLERLTAEAVTQATGALEPSLRGAIRAEARATRQRRSADRAPSSRPGPSGRR